MLRKTSPHGPKGLTFMPGLFLILNNIVNNLFRRLATKLNDCRPKAINWFSMSAIKQNWRTPSWAKAICVTQYASIRWFAAVFLGRPAQHRLFCLMLRLYPVLRRLVVSIHSRSGIKNLSMEQSLINLSGPWSRDNKVVDAFCPDPLHNVK